MPKVNHFLKQILFNFGKYIGTITPRMFSKQERFAYFVRAGPGTGSHMFSLNPRVQNHRYVRVGS